MELYGAISPIFHLINCNSTSFTQQNSLVQRNNATKIFVILYSKIYIVPNCCLEVSNSAMCFVSHSVSRYWLFAEVISANTFVYSLWTRQDESGVRFINYFSSCFVLSTVLQAFIGCLRCSIELCGIYVDFTWPVTGNVCTRNKHKDRVLKK